MSVASKIADGFTFAVMVALMAPVFIACIILVCALNICAWHHKRKGMLP